MILINTVPILFKCQDLILLIIIITLLKLIPWLKQWHHYTTIEKRGTTNQFIQSHPIFYVKKERDERNSYYAIALAFVALIVVCIVVTQV